MFLPHILRQHLLRLDLTAATSLAIRYQRLPYFSHALEVLLHTVLDDEVDNTLSSEDDSLLPSVLRFLSTFPDYLDIIVQCTRKTEVRSWRTLFAHLPPPQQLFEQSLGKGLLKTAGGYLLVLHTFQELGSSSEQCVRLLQRAKEADDWDLCKELARFLMALDESGEALREALARMDLQPPEETEEVRLKTPRINTNSKRYVVNKAFPNSSSPISSGVQTPRSQALSDEGGTVASEDYFSPRSQ